MGCQGEGEEWLFAPMSTSFRARICLKDAGLDLLWLKLLVILGPGGGVVRTERDAVPEPAGVRPAPALTFHNVDHGDPAGMAPAVERRL